MDSVLSELEAATSQIKKQLTSNKGGTKAEARYSAAYQAAVAAGLRLQIKKKYR